MQRGFILYKMTVMLHGLRSLGYHIRILKISIKQSTTECIALMTAWTNYLQYISFQIKHHLQFRAWIFKSMASIYLSLRISYLLGREVLLWGHARAGGRGHRGTVTAPFEQRSHSLQPPHLGKELGFSRIWNCEIFWRNPARCVQRYRWRRGQIPEQITE